MNNNILTLIMHFLARTSALLISVILSASEIKCMSENSQNNNSNLNQVESSNASQQNPPSNNPSNQHRNLLSQDWHYRQYNTRLNGRMYPRQNSSRGRSHLQNH